MNTTNTAPSLTPEQIAQCRKVHLAIVAQANTNGMDAIEYAEHLGPEAFEDVVANELTAQGVDPDVWDAWYASPDAQTEFEQNMGADMPRFFGDASHTPLFLKQRIVLAYAQDAMTDSYDTSIADALVESMDNTSAQDSLDLVREAVEYHTKLTAWAIAQRFRANLRTTLGNLMQERTPPYKDASEVMGKVHGILCDIDFVNGENGPDSNVCASHDHCDANMPMSEAFAEVMGREIDLQNQDEIALWNEAWRIAKAEGFAFPTFKLS